MMCGVDKLSMAITDLSDGVEGNMDRSCWMIIMEGWFGFCVKFISPVILMWLLCSNLVADMKQLYGDDNTVLHIYSSVPVLIAFAIIFGSMFSCEWQEKFYHDINKEFEADQKYSRAINDDSLY